MRPSFSCRLEAVPLRGMAPHAEAHLDGRVLTVHIDLPHVPPEDLEVDVQQRSIRLRSRSRPDAFHVGYGLPRDVDGDAFVMVARNGVLEFRILRL
jgi:HSP20 family molecular chaperone IbpA